MAGLRILVLRFMVFNMLKVSSVYKVGEIQGKRRANTGIFDEKSSSKKESHQELMMWKIGARRFTKVIT